MLRFIVNSDLHYTKDGPRSRQRHAVTKLTSFWNTAESLDAVVVPGDLTEHGNDANRFGLGGPHGDELKALKEQYVAPLETLGINLLMTAGNHDGDAPYFFYQPVERYINQKYDAFRQCYGRCIKGVHFISLGRFPDVLRRLWLRWYIWLNQLEKKQTPVIFFFHYNLQGAFSDWMPDRDKRAFFDVIKNLRIICIVTGHWHVTLRDSWKGIPVFIGADHMWLVEYNTQTGSLTQQTIFI